MGNSSAIALNEPSISFSYNFPASSIISGRICDFEVYDSGLGLTGDISNTDNFFSEEMSADSDELDDIIRSLD